MSTVGQYRPRAQRYGSLSSYARMAYTAGKYASRAYSAYSKSGSPPPNKTNYAKPKKSVLKAKAKKRFRKARMSKTKKKMQSVTKRLSALEKSTTQTMGEHINHIRNTGNVVGVINEAVYQTITANTGGIIEAAGTGLKYFDSGLPNTPDEINISDGDYTHPTLIKSIYSSLTLVNNYKVTANLKVYYLVPKDDTSKAPYTAFTQGITDKFVALADYQNPMLNLSDSEVFQELWKIKKMVKNRLLPGERLVINNSEKNIMYEPTVNDVHSDTYQPAHKAGVYLIRLVGPLSHQPTGTAIGRAKAGVDWEMNRKYVISYPAGRNIKTIYLDDNTNTITSGVATNSPVVDNQTYAL